MAVIGSVYASLYATRLTARSRAHLPAAVAGPRGLGRCGADRGGQAGRLGHPGLAAAVHNAASSAFFHGFHAADYVSMGVAAAGALMALVLLPAAPRRSTETSAAAHSHKQPALSAFASARQLTIKEKR